MPRNVWLIGLTSLFTDISSEMVAAVLPLYFVVELKLTPQQFGLVEGLYQAAAALFRLAAGVVADVRGAFKRLAVAGYGLSAICRGGMLVARDAAPLTGLLLVDRLGKGIRTAPRDALITFSSPPERLGEAFGVHRALDTVGAMLGPVLAFALLATSVRRFDAVFTVSFVASLLGLLVLVLLVKQPRVAAAPDRRPTRAHLAGLLGRPRFRRLALAGFVLAACTASDGMLYLLLQQDRGAVSTTVFPLLFVATASVYLTLALPFGRMADVIGRVPVFLAGHVAVIALYLIVGPLGLSGGWAAAVTVCLLGVYYASTDGVLAAIAGSSLPTGEVATGLAVVGTVVSLGRLVAAAVFGACWSWFGSTAALGLFATSLAVALAVSFRLIGARDTVSVPEAQ